MARRKKEEAATEAKGKSLKQHEEITFDAQAIPDCDRIRVTDPDGDTFFVRAGRVGRDTDGAGAGPVTISFAEKGDYTVEYFGWQGVHVKETETITVK